MLAKPSPVSAISKDRGRVGKSAASWSIHDSVHNVVAARAEGARRSITIGADYSLNCNAVATIAALDAFLFLWWPCPLFIWSYR
jgi:hypothetical protein